MNIRSQLSKIIETENLEDFKAFVDNNLTELKNKSIVGVESIPQIVTSKFDKDNSSKDKILTSMLEYLLEEGFDFNSYDDVSFSPLFNLIDEDKPKQIRTLLENKINVNITNEELETALIRATLKGHHEVLSVLLEYIDNAILNKAGSYLAKTPLGVALFKEDIESVKILLKAGADPYAVDNDMQVTIESIQENASQDFKEKVNQLLKNKE